MLLRADKNKTTNIQAEVCGLSATIFIYKHFSYQSQTAGLQEAVKTQQSLLPFLLIKPKQWNNYILNAWSHVSCKQALKVSPFKYAAHMKGEQSQQGDYLIRHH